MDIPQNYLFSVGRWLFKSVDIASQKGWIQPKALGKAAYVNLFVGKEEPLQGRGLGLIIPKAFKTDIDL